MKKFLCTVLTVFMLCMLFVGCDKSNSKSETGKKPSTDVSSDEIVGKWIAFSSEIDKSKEVYFLQEVVFKDDYTVSIKAKDYLNYDTLDTAYRMYIDFKWEKTSAGYTAKSEKPTDDSRIFNFVLIDEKLLMENSKLTFTRDSFKSDAAFLAKRMSFITNKFETTYDKSVLGAGAYHAVYDYNTDGTLIVDKSGIVSIDAISPKEQITYNWAYDEKFDIIWYTQSKIVRIQKIVDEKIDGLYALDRTDNGISKIEGTYKYNYTTDYGGYTCSFTFKFNSDGTAMLTGEGNSTALSLSGLPSDKMPLNYTYQYSAALGYYIISQNSMSCDLLLKLDNGVVTLPAIGWPIKLAFNKM